MNSLTQSLSRETTVALLSIAMSLTKKTYGIFHSCPLQTVWGCEGMQQKASYFMVGWQVCMLTTGSAACNQTVFSKALSRSWKWNVVFWRNQFLIPVWINFVWPASMVGFWLNHIFHHWELVCVCVRVCVCRTFGCCSSRFDLWCVFNRYTSWEWGCLIPKRACLEDWLPPCLSSCQFKANWSFSTSQVLLHWPLKVSVA